MAESTLTTTADCYIVSDAPTTNTGSGLTMEIGELTGTTSTRRALIKFDLSSITETITSAKLKLWETGDDYSSNARTMYVNRMKRAWTGNGATWNKYDGSNDWSTAGGMSNADDMELTEIGTKSFTDTPVAGYHEITLDASKVEEMRLGTFTNNGFGVSFGTENDDAHQFLALENGESQAPKLVVTYTLPTSGSVGYFHFM